jgi:hypothetical protein
VSELGELVVGGCRQLAAAVDALEHGRPVYEFTREVTRLEERADEVLRAAEAELFSAESDAVRLIKRKEVLEHLESVTDRCEDVADILENIAVKNA